MELSKQEMELFSLLPDLQSKNLFYKRFVITSKDSKNGFENRKWNYPNREWNYFPYFCSKNFFYKTFLTFTMESKTGVEKRKWNYPNSK